MDDGPALAGDRGHGEPVGTDSRAGGRTREGAEFRELAGDLKAAFRAWGERPEPWPERRFEHFALRAFALQFGSNEPYRKYCEARGATPGTVGSWREVPPAPTGAFRRVPLGAGPMEAAALEFRTSGTTRGRERRGRHRVRDPELYRASLEPAFSRFVLGETGAVPDRAGDVRAGEALQMCSLVPPFSQAPDSSLSWMIDAVMERFGAAGSGHVAGSDGVDWAAARRFAERAEGEGDRVCLLATTLGLAEWTRRLAANGVRIRLPEGSRVVDTGGTKGRESPDRAEVLGTMERVLGIPPGRAINEFGMTELLSQRYGAGPLLRGPPWLRSRALDPVTLAELPEEETGVLCHFDLANAGSVCAVLTEDLGRVRGEALEWIGRSPGAPPRGCSLATAELLAAAEEGKEA